MSHKTLADHSGFLIHQKLKIKKEKKLELGLHHHQLTPGKAFFFSLSHLLLTA
jgi:hypothetical protein